MNRLVSHCVMLVTCFALIIFWQRISVASNTPVIVGALSMLYLLYIIKGRMLHKIKKASYDHATIFFLLMTATMLIILSTGGLNSPLFFLLYFVIFCLTFMIEPTTVFLFLVLLFITVSGQFFIGISLTNVIKLSSLVLLSPLAYIFGYEYRGIDQQRTSIVDLIKQDALEVIQNEAKNISQDDIVKLHEIVEQSDKLETLHKE